MSIISKYSGLVIALTNFVISLFVYFKNRKGRVNKIFPLYSLSIGFWSFCWFRMYTSLDQGEALYWAKALSIGSAFIPAFFLHFVFIILDIVKEKKYILVGSYLFTFILLCLCYFTDLFIKGVSPFAMYNYHIQPGPLYILHPSSFTVITIYCLTKLFKASKIYVGLKRNQLKYLFGALVVGYAGGITAFFPIYRISIPPSPAYTISICILIIGYSIIKYHLLDIVVIITRTSIFIATYTLVLGFPFIFTTLGRGWLVELLGINWWLAPLILLAVLAGVGPFVYIYLQKRAEAILLREQHRYRKTLEQAARELASIHNLKKLLNLIVYMVTKTVRILYSAIYLYDEESKHFSLKASRNFKRTEIFSLNEENPLIIQLKNKREPLVYEEINRRVQENPAPLLRRLEEEMRSLGAVVAIPGFLRDRLLGLLILGNKRSGRFYTSEDLNTFSVLANEAALAIENAILYESMEEKIKQKTEELSQTQRQLFQAEKLATVGTLAGGVAHEINNPLTAILTNVQMLLADTNLLDKDSEESLRLIEEATKRCRTIVQKLMVYAKRPSEPLQTSEVNLSDVIQNVVSLLNYHLTQENIKIITDIKEDEFLVSGNQNELEQVLTNIILNARDATKKIRDSGSIHVSLLKDRDWIKIEVKDEGIGVPKEILSKIFDPFFTTKDVGKGLGLGLSISQAIIEKHNGKILAQSEPNKGSIFTIQLPKKK